MAYVAMNIISKNSRPSQIWDFVLYSGWSGLHFDTHHVLFRERLLVSNVEKTILESFQKKCHFLRGKSFFVQKALDSTTKK